MVTCLSQLPPLFLVILVISAAPRTPAQPLQHEIPYFVDAAGAEYDLEQEAREVDRTRGRSPAERAQAVLLEFLRCVEIVELAVSYPS